MKDKLTLRDKLAMSMPKDAIPELNNLEAVKFMADKLGLEWSDDPMVQLDFSLRYQAIVRYQYADAMLETR